VPYDALLLISFGGPERHEDVIPFLENVLRGRNVPRERMLAVAEHYYHFDGRSPINDHCRSLVEELRRVSDLPVYWGNRNWHPMLNDTVAQMAKNGVKHALAIATSAYSSHSSCRQYLENIASARAAVGESAPIIDKLPPFCGHPLFVEANVARVKAVLETLPPDRRAGSRLVFTAHSIPTSMASASQYEPQLLEAATRVAGSLGIDEFDMAWQSRSGPPSQPWLEPDILDHLRYLASRDVRDVVIAPIGFLSDHMEVLYDLDFEAKNEAARLGMTLVRAETAGLHPLMVEMFRNLIARARAGEFEQRFCDAGCCPAPQRAATQPGRP
jgi:ferrochelatase